MQYGIKLSGLNMGIDTDRSNYSMPGMPWKVWFAFQLEKIGNAFFKAGILLAFIPLAGLLAGCKTDDFDFDIPPVVVPTTTTTTVSAPTTTTQPAIIENDNEHNIVPIALYEPIYSIDGATEGKVSVWNPANSKGKGKAIFAGKYCNKIAWCTFFANGFAEKGKRAFPNESSNRPRFYTLTGIDALPTSIYIRIHIVDNGVAKDIWVFIPDTRKRMG